MRSKLFVSFEHEYFAKIDRVRNCMTGLQIHYASFSSDSDSASVSAFPIHLFSNGTPLLCQISPTTYARPNIHQIQER